MELVRFDDDSPPTSTSLSDAGSGATAAFTEDGKRLAFAVMSTPGVWEVRVASTPDGEKLDVTWSLPRKTQPTLVWGGAEALVADYGDEEASSVLRVEDGSLLDIGLGVQVTTAANHSALVAVRDNRILYVGRTSDQWSAAIPGSWLVRLSTDGSGLALFSQSEVPAFDFPIATTRIQWSPPPPPPCSRVPQSACPETRMMYTPGEMDWPSIDSRMIVEFDDSGGDKTLMDLAFVPPSKTATLTAPVASVAVLRRNWGVQSNGDWFIVTNPNDALTEPWLLNSFQADGKILRVQGPIAFAQYAVSSGDESAVFVISYSRVAEKTTVFAISSPTVKDTEPKALFSTNQQVNALWPQPKGPSILIETGDPTVPGAPTDTVYFVRNGDTPALSLPKGLGDLQWTADGGGFVGTLAGSVLYFSGATPERPITLGHGRYVLPSQW
ncbi:MAG: hypothetical protein ABW061_28360 [Polyangiaceae bacterium]